MKNLIYGAAMLFTITSCTTQPITSDSLIGERYEIDLVSFESSALGTWEDTTYLNYGIIWFYENEVVTYNANGLEESLDRLGAMFELGSRFEVEYLGDLVVMSIEIDGLKQEATWVFDKSRKVITLHSLEDWSSVNPLYSVKLEKTLILTEL